MTHLNAAHEEHFLHVSATQGKAVVEPQGVLDDGHGQSVAVRLGIGHGGSASPDPVKATQPFLMVLPDTEPGQARTVADRLLQAIRTQPWPARVPLTASLGVTSARPDELQEQLTERADQHLYRARALGRNRAEGDVTADNSGAVPVPRWPAGGSPGDESAVSSASVLTRAVED